MVWGLGFGYQRIWASGPQPRTREPAPKPNLGFRVSRFGLGFRNVVPEDLGVRIWALRVYDVVPEDLGVGFWARRVQGLGFHDSVWGLGLRMWYQRIWASGSRLGVKLLIT